MYETCLREIHDDERPAFLLVSTVAFRTYTVMRSQTRLLTRPIYATYLLGYFTSMGDSLLLLLFPGRCLLNSGR
ncbi:hypothetical protein CPB86DRAFT_106224 [Serendipita vermifera]|nr:hypothetical protein CPB86DRAFT_106224 [Serendipita vermifera]